MNKSRRAQIQSALDKITEARAVLEQCRDEEQEYYDAMPEGIQNGSRGDAAQETIDNLEEAISILEDAESNCETVINA